MNTRLLRPSTLLFSGLFANGLYRKIESTPSIVSSSIHNELGTPLYSVALLFAAANHTWLFPYHLYIDHIDPRSKPQLTRVHNELFQFLYM
jgi:hypothetical protein